MIAGAENRAEGTTKVLGYVRVSTDEQADRGVSLAAQRAGVVALAAARGLDLVEVIEDAGASARTLRRDGLRRALASLRAGEVGGLVVAKLDRLTRSVRDWAGLCDEHFGAPRGPRLYSAAEDLDLKTASGRMVANIMMSVAQYEREAIVERTQGAMDHKAGRGERLGTIPYGRRLVEGGKRLEPAPAEVEAIAAIRGMRLAGLTFRAIAGALDQRGLGSRSGRPWSSSTVAQILKRQP